MSVHKILTNERLLAMFKQFDTDNSGFITYDDIAEAMIKLGQKITP
jgi:Ca2+-binding EF-hand superfamily protein